MEVADLRGLDLFDGLSDEQLGELVTAGAEVADRARGRALPRGRARRLLVGARGRRHRPGAARRSRGRRGRAGWTCRAAGPAGSGPGTSTASTSRPAAGPCPGGCCGCPPRCCATARTRGSRSPGTSSAGSTRPRAPSSRRPASASPWSPSARSPPGSPTRSTTPRPRRPAPSASLEDACQTLLSSLGQLAHGDISAEQFLALDALRGELAPSQVALDPLELADLEDALSTWLAAARGRPRLGDRPHARGRRRRRRVVRAGCGRPRRRRRWSPGLEWVASTFAATTLLGRGEGVDPAGLRPGRLGAVLLADGPRLGAADRREGRRWRAP